MGFGSLKNQRKPVSRPMRLRIASASEGLKKSCGPQPEKLNMRPRPGPVRVLVSRLLSVMTSQAYKLERWGFRVFVICGDGGIGRPALWSGL